MTDYVYDSISKRLFHGCDWANEEFAHFCDVYGYDITQLVFDGIIELNDKPVYYAPKYEDIIEFLNNHPNISCHGYVKINDGVPKVVVEGFYSTSFTEKDREDFLRFALFSDIIRDNLFPTILYSRW